MFMNKKVLVTLSMVIMALVICFSVSPVAVRAEGNSTYTYTDKSGTITLSKNEDDWLIVSGNNGRFVLGQGASSYGFDQYGTAWRIQPGLDTISGWNYYIQYDEEEVFYNYIFEENGEYVMDAESLIFDDKNQYVIGYKTFSGDIKSLLSYDEIVAKTADNPKKGPDPTPTPTAPSTPKPIPSSPSQPVTPVNPGVTTPVPTVPVVTPNVTPNVTPDVTTNPTTSPNAPQKLSIKKQKSKISLYVGSKLMSSYGLKKGTLTWNVGKKTGKVKNVKAVGYIKKSKNLIYITKNGKAYIISSKGKKKVILKKGARKLTFKDGFVIKIKKSSGSTNVVNY